MPFTVSFHSECEFCEYDVPHGMRVNLSGYDYHPREEHEEFMLVGENGLLITLEEDE